MNMAAGGAAVRVWAPPDRGGGSRRRGAQPQRMAPLPLHQRRSHAKRVRWMRTCSVPLSESSACSRMLPYPTPPAGPRGCGRLVGWSFGRSVRWFVGWVVRWLGGWVVGWSQPFGATRNPEDAPQAATFRECLNLPPRQASFVVRIFFPNFLSKPLCGLSKK